MELEIDQLSFDQQIKQTLKLQSKGDTISQPDFRKQQALKHVIPKVSVQLGKELVKHLIWGQQQVDDVQVTRAYYAFYLVHCMSYSQNRTSALVGLYEQLVHESLLKGTRYLLDKFAQFNAFAVMIDAGHKLKRGALGVIKYLYITAFLMIN